ncbi:MAG: ROK family protein, partial [Puniceicoccales bacterium]
ALIDGEVVFTEEIKWDPYFQNDPRYHIEGIQDSLERAAKHLPRVDAIGGSAAGVYVNSEPRVASLFRGVPKDDFQRAIRPIFQELQKQWNDVPFVVHNDGDVTALAGAMSLGANGVLGISMGTSEAAGYINREGVITGWLNELAFAPVDYRMEAPADEWSGDRGCGVQYFSQQAVGRLIGPSGLEIDQDLPLPERLEMVQDKVKKGDERAFAIYQTIGTYFGYTVAHYSDFYDFQHLLFLGRVSSGQGGQIIQQQAERVLADEYPELADKIAISMPDEKMKRHGQAVAAASLPVLTPVV